MKNLILKSLIIAFCVVSLSINSYAETQDDLNIVMGHPLEQTVIVDYTTGHQSWISDECGKNMKKICYVEASSDGGQSLKQAGEIINIFVPSTNTGFINVKLLKDLDNDNPIDIEYTETNDTMIVYSYEEWLNLLN